MRAVVDNRGKVYNYLKVIEQKREKIGEKNRTYYYCECLRCGDIKWIRADLVTSGRQVSCGCYNAENNLATVKNITDKVFGKLTAKYDTGKRDKNNGAAIWYCECECGNTKEASSTDLDRLGVSSCGCIAKEWQSKHGKEIGAIIKEGCIEKTNVRNLTMKIRNDNTSGHKGVTWDKERNKWYVSIGFQGKPYYLGRYDDKNDAIEVRSIAEKKIFGEFLEWYEEYKQTIHKQHKQN
ncbi:hypothetical protein [Lachnoclostridium sp.]|uniref:hypothetical protein n=1 Tax=Lachnoclostridium sp. TaxID=2028282 RepID=UPI00289B8039|nr:hypothetical protein [Lachnoclostridium sp.]